MKKDNLNRGEFLFDDKKYAVVEKPTIPQFVADYLKDVDAKHESKVRYLVEAYHGDSYYLVEMLVEEGCLEQESGESLAEWAEKQDLSKLLKLINGYEVEEEQKYILSINITDKASKTNYETFLNKRGIFHSMENESFNSEEFSWTEEEIKGLESGEILFEHFATKIEELEE